MPFKRKFYHRKLRKRILFSKILTCLYTFEADRPTNRFAIAFYNYILFRQRSNENSDRWDKKRYHTCYICLIYKEFTCSVATHLISSFIFLWYFFRGRRGQNSLLFGEFWKTATMIIHGLLYYLRVLKIPEGRLEKQIYWIQLWKWESPCFS